MNLYQFQSKPPTRLLTLPPRKDLPKIRPFSLNPRRIPPFRRTRTCDPPPLLLSRLGWKSRKHGRTLCFGVLSEIRMCQHFTGRRSLGRVQGE